MPNKNEDTSQEDNLTPSKMYVFYLKDGRKVLSELISIQEVNGSGLLGMLNKKIVGYNVLRRFKEEVLNEKNILEKRSYICKSYIKEEEVAEIVYAYHHYDNTLSTEMNRMMMPQKQIRNYNQGGFQ